MFGTTRGMLVPARKHLFAVTLAVFASVPVAASADPTMVNVRTVPRLEGAVDGRPETFTVNYYVPGTVAATTLATKKLLAADGWVQYVRPFENVRSTLNFKRGPHGLNVSFRQIQPNQSEVNYGADRIYANVPFPDDATDIIFNERRPYLGCTTAASVETSLEFFRKELIAAGWSPLSAADAAARYPGATIDASISNGARAFYSFPKRDGYQQQPIMLTLQRRDDGKTSVDVRIAPFAHPQSLELARETAGLPVPNQTAGFGSEGDSSSNSRKVHGAVQAELPVVLAFFRRELGVRNCKEETRGAVETPDQIVLNFSSPDQTATLRLKPQYDLTIINLTTQVTEAGMAARAKAKKEADAKFFSDAAAMAKEIIAADEVRRVEQAAKMSDAPLRPLADNSKPVPLPENAEEVQFEGAKGRLDFYSPSSVRAVAAFYRGALQAQGWKERPSVINNPRMVVMDFSKGGKAMSFTVMQMGPRSKISADGSALVTADAKMAAKPGAAGDQASSGAAAKATVQVLEVDPETDADAPFPMPKQRGSTVSRGSGKLPGSNVPFRRELEISVPADLASVLAFYRTELGKRGWKESAERAVMQADRVQLAFASPDGPAQLKLGRAKDETTVSLAQKYTDVAAKADVIPKPGQARLVFGNMGGSEAAVTINKQTIKLAAGAGGPQSQKPPMLDLPPGKYTYSVKVAGRPARNDTVEVTADDAWGLIIAPSGEALSLQMY
ncbi:MULTISPECIES: hypothetical protein [unclassified Bradyrhizobium]|uniref:hypothetical protein n=1 Tax=unclassified Bradyrhizobium TaxID=2631580 RepID=UPI001BA8EFA3|nr:MULTISPECIES: hypothetical protein [unclassified Bradyrhizobium]MBR1223722.1 hypothetical protein [Bradyrhizobium sp. AUGA SZCCT0176]MBR1296327.1 hypothetical protein [Bradyrhizobium sp. AUGA SZCCT0042]